MRYTFLAMATLATVVGLADEASACSCMYLSPCALYGRSDAVFVGDVVEVGEEATNDWGRIVQVRVVRAGKGVDAGQLVRLDVPSEGSSCAMGFEVGQRWMVFAHAGQGRMGTSGCSGTHRLSLDARLPDLPARGGTVHGSLRTLGAGGDPELQGLADVPAWIDTPDGRIATRTDRDGFYRLEGVPPGEWKIQFDPGKGLAAQAFADVTAGQDCYGVGALARPAGGIAGSVVDEAGAPVIAASVIALPASGREGREDHMGRTDERGEFQMRAVPPGAYVLRVGYAGEINGFFPYRPVFYPAASERAGATTIDVRGDVVRLPAIVMRDAVPTASIPVDIVCSDGTRPAKAFAYAEHRDDDGVERREHTSRVNAADGRTIRVRLGRRYAVKGMVLARTTGLDGAETDWIPTTAEDLDPARPPAVLRLQSELRGCDAPGGPSLNGR
jgi:hypothetical protein